MGELGKRLVKKGHEVTVVTIKHQKGLASKEKIEGIEVVRFDQPEIKFLGLIYTWFWLLKNSSLIKRSNIIHCHDVFIWYLPFRLLFKKPVFTTFHGWEGIYPVPRKNIIQKKLAAYFTFKNICVGKYIEKYYGIKADTITYGATEIPRTIPKKEKSIVYVGRLDEDTGLPVFLKALEELKGYKVDFCGDGSLARECKKLGKVHGFINPNPFLSKAQICFVSGYLSILEAMAHKCIAVAAYDNPLKKDYYKLTPFSKWIIISNSPDEISKKIQYYSKHEKQTKKLIEGGYAWVKQQTWEKLTGLYLKLWGAKSR